MPSNPRPSSFTDIATENNEIYIKDNQGNITSHIPELLFAEDVTLAQLQAGRVLINGVKGKKIRPIKVSMYIKGQTFTGGTAIVVQDNSIVPIVIATGNAGSLTVGAKLQTDGTILVVGAGLWELMPDGNNIVLKADSAFTTGGTAFIVIQYQLV